MNGMKYHPHGSVLFITFSIEEGLLLLSNPLIEILIKSCLARALTLYPNAISHLIIEDTHVHLILVINEPKNVPEFMRHFKSEVAHRINNLLGREKRTVWCEGYDSPIVLSPTRAITAIAYLYSNPSKDNLVDSIEQYPGISSWKMFNSNENETVNQWQYFSRAQFRELGESSHNLGGYTKEAQRLMTEGSKTNTFTISPNAWLEAFGIMDTAEQERINKIIKARVIKLEDRARKKRIKEGKTAIGADRLMRQVLDLTYRPKRTGRRMWCIADRRRIRVPFINFLKQQFSRAREIRKLWFVGDYSQPYPLGLYPPSMPKLAEPLCAGC